MFGRKKKEEKIREWIEGLSKEEYRRYIDAIDELYPILKDMGLSEEEIYKEIGKRLNLETEKVVALVERLNRENIEKIEKMVELFKKVKKGEEVDIFGSIFGSATKASNSQTEGKNGQSQPSQLSDKELLMEILKELKRNNELLTALIVRFDEHRNREEEKYAEFVEWLAKRFHSLEIAAS